MSFSYWLRALTWISPNKREKKIQARYLQQLSLVSLQKVTYRSFHTPSLLLSLPRFLLWFHKTVTSLKSGDGESEYHFKVYFCIACLNPTLTYKNTRFVKVLPSYVLHSFFKHPFPSVHLYCPNPRNNRIHYSQTIIGDGSNSWTKPAAQATHYTVKDN